VCRSLSATNPSNNAACATCQNDFICNNPTAATPYQCAGCDACVAQHCPSFDGFQSLLKPEFWHSTLHSWSSFSKLFEAAKSNFESGKFYVLKAYDKNVPQEIKKIDWSEVWSAIAVAFVQTWEAVKRWWTVALLISEPCMVIGKICLDAMLPHLQTAVVVGWELFVWQLKENPHLVAACFLCMVVLYAIWRFGVLGRVHRRYQEIKRAIGQHT
jgi:hypothetical protein